MAMSYDQWMRQATSSENNVIPPNSDGLLHVGERAALVEQLSYLKKRNAQLMKQQRAVLLAACEAQAAHAQCADFAGELMRAQMAEHANAPTTSSQSSKTRRRPGAGAPAESSADDAAAGPSPAGGVDMAADDSAAASSSANNRGAQRGLVLDQQQQRRRDEEQQRQDEVVDKLQRLEHENQELLRKTAVLVDYVRATAPMPRSAQGLVRDDDDDDSDDDDDDFDGVAGDDKDLPPKRRRGHHALGGLASSCLPEPTAFDHFATRRVRECKWDAFVAGVLSAFGGGGGAGGGASGHLGTAGGGTAGGEDD